LVDSDQHRNGEQITRCLAAFTKANINGILQTLVDHNIFWPSMPFHKASSEIRDALIARVETDSKNRNHILLALAWIGDHRVVDLFGHWRHHPPNWRNSLYIPPEDYSREAGWEISSDGQRRNLYFQKCFHLKKGKSESPDGFVAITPREDICPWCNSRLTNLFDLRPSLIGFHEIGMSPDRFQILTCEVCTDFGPIFGTLNKNGEGHWSPMNLKPEYLPNDIENWGRLPQDCLFVAEPRNPFFAADQFLPTSFSQMGGHPTWIQNADYPKCPGCSKTMMFLAQIAHEEIEDFSDGTFYAFICTSCQVTATVYQQT
jgi:hypothetical protein